MATCEKCGIEYLAGFFDGEGSIGVYFMSCRQGRCYKLQIAVTSTHRGAVELFYTYFGNVGCFSGKSRHDRKHAVCWDWKVVGQDALVVLKQLVPYLTIKKPEAELAIEFQEHLLETKHATQQTEYRDSIVNRLKSMKQSYKVMVN